MFGSSEDRARQLAARKRKARINFDSSSSSDRSVSSSSQASQKSQTASTLEHNFQSAYVIKHSFHETGISHHFQRDHGGFYSTQQLDDKKLYHMGHDTLHMMNETLPFKMKQQSLQAEHLSEVLYNSRISSAPTRPLQSDLAIFPRRKGYGDLGAHFETSHRPRSGTAIPLPKHPTILQIENIDTRFNFHPHQMSQDWPTPSRPFEREFPWASRVSHLTAWESPISSGPLFNTFLDTLSEKQLEVFLHLFDPRSSSEALESKASISRKWFFSRLNSEQQQLLKRIINLKGMELLAQDQDCSPEEPILRFTASGTETKPCTTLYNLLDATEDPPSSIRPTALSGLHARSNSTPDLRTQEQYYSSGAGAAASPAAKTTLNKIFDKHKEPGATDPDIVGVDGTMKYFQEIDVDVEGLESLAALEVVQAPTMGEMSREGFVNGWQEKNCDTIDKQKAFIKNLKREMPNSQELFTRVYRYTFLIAKTGGQKAVALDAAVAYWELLFSSPLSAVKWTSPNSPWLQWWTEFLNSSWKKSVNKDMWNETLKFALLTLNDEAMSFWNEESSWPSVIDDFVEWVKKEKRGGGKDEVMDVDY